MPYKYSKEDYTKLLNVSCLDVAQALGMTIDEGNKTTEKSIHIKDSGGLYIFPDKNNWFRHSDGAKGFPIDLVTDTLNCSRDEALDFISRNVAHGIYEQASYSYKPHSAKPVSNAEKTFVVPPHNTKPSHVPAYLIKTRGIDKDIVYGMISRGAIAEDEAHHNCLFFGRDNDGNIRSCAVRGTTSKQFRGEVSGGDKTYSFAMEGKNDILRVFESPIDAMSHATFSKLLGKDWTADHRLSTNGCGCYQAMREYLANHSEIKRISINFDNDVAGQKADVEIRKKILADFPDRNLIIRSGNPIFKDWNEDLQVFRESNFPVQAFVKMTAEEISQAIESDCEDDEECLPF
jgi:hypothetical protein